MIIMGKTSFSYNWKVDKVRTALTVRKKIYTEKMHQICNTTDMGGICNLQEMLWFFFLLNHHLFS